MTITERYKTAQKDYNTLLRLYNSSGADDITGGWVADERLFELLENPCKKVAAEIYESLILRCYTCGFEEGTDWDSDCSITMDIFERHCCAELSGTGGDSL